MSDQENIDAPPSEEIEDDVALRPGANADNAADVARYISAEVRARYEVYSYRHAAAILATSFPAELAEIEQALLNFSMTKHDIGMPGKNESDIPKKYSHLLRPHGWVETRIQGDLLVRMQEFDEELLANGKTRKRKLPEGDPHLIENFIDGHKIDYVNGC